MQSEEKLDLIRLALAKYRLLIVLHFWHYIESDMRCSLYCDALTHREFYLFLMYKNSSSWYYAADLMFEMKFGILHGIVHWLYQTPVISRLNFCGICKLDFMNMELFYVVRFTANVEKSFCFL